MKKKYNYRTCNYCSLALIALMKNKDANAEKIAIVAEKNASVSVKVANVKTEEITLDL
jgi:hypothetical protein